MLATPVCLRCDPGYEQAAREKRIRMLSMLVEGSSMRSITRARDASIKTVVKLLDDTGEVFHSETVRNVRSKRVQCDEICAFWPR